MYFFFDYVSIHDLVLSVLPDFGSYPYLVYTSHFSVMAFIFLRLGRIRTVSATRVVIMSTTTTSGPSVLAYLTVCDDYVMAVPMEV